MHSRAHLIDSIDALLTLEREAIQAYATAIDYVVDEPMTRATLVSFRADQLRHLSELQGLWSALSPTASKPPSATSDALIKDRSAYAGLPGTTAILRVLKANEDLLVRRYRAVLQERLPPGVLDVIRAHTNDQLRHRAWIAARVDAFAKSAEWVSAAGSATPSRSSWF